MMITRSYTPRHNENNQDTPPKSTPPAARAPYHSRSWLIWLISASTSLLSARYLLIENNFHYPLLLYVTHLLFTFAVALKQCSWRRQAQESEYQNSRRSRTVLGTLIVSATVCLTAVSTSFMFQAILHFRNFPTLIMLTAIAFSVESILLLLVNGTSGLPVEILRITALLLSCVGILASEYRLSVANLATSMIAIITAGIASALRKIAGRYRPHDVLDRKLELRWLVGVGCFVAAASAYFAWDEQRLISINVRVLPLLALHAASTTSAMLIGKSVFFDADEPVSGDKLPGNGTALNLRGTLSLLALTGITGCYSTLAVRRSYTNLYQYCCFALAILCISHRTVYDWDSSTTYEPLQDLSLPLPEEEGSTTSTEKLERAQSTPSRSDLWKNTLRTSSSVVVVLLLWTVYMSMNFTERERKQHIASLDRTHHEPTLPLEVVISMYKEPTKVVNELISSLEHLPVTSGALITIYVKDSEANTEELREQTGANKVIKLPNMGREGETYLSHIINRWDSLAKQTIFLQAEVHNPHEFSKRLAYLNPAHTGFLNLGWSDVCDCNDCGDRFFWSDKKGLFRQIHEQVYNSTECDNVLLSYKGQFVVSAARIRGISRTIYERLWQTIVDETSWVHQPQFLQGRPDSMSAPHFGYTIERIWSLLFQCSDLDVGWKCPTLLSGWRLGGDAGDCQCFDSDLDGV